MIERRKTAVIGAAAVAGVVAAGIVYLLYRKPHWRRQVVEVGHHLLNFAEGIIKRGQEAALDEMPTARR